MPNFIEIKEIFLWTDTQTDRKKMESLNKLFYTSLQRHR